jgi:hypothetical protein
MQQHARDLLSTALLETNSAALFLENRHFKEYIRYISGDRYQAPSRYLHMETVKAIAANCHEKIKCFLTRSNTFAIEVDSWTGDGRKFTAITAGLFCKSTLL